MNDRDATFARHIDSLLGDERSPEDRLEALERSTEQLERRIEALTAPKRPDPLPLLR